jgi:hypothetical protein
MTELVVDGKSRTVDIGAFTPERFMSRGSKRGRKKQDMEIGEQW